MKLYVEKHNDSKIQICIARILQLLEEEDKQSEAVMHLQKAAGLGSPYASYLLWKCNYNDLDVDRATEIQALRELRDIASVGELEATLEVCRMYTKGKFGGISSNQAKLFVQDFYQQSKPSHIHSIYRNKELTHSMRYILVDWLVEVAGMKDFSSQTLHAAVHMVDRYLKCHLISRSRLQLLGVAAMVLCSRFLGKDIITIREAAWLTDNTYKYEDVVRMMGEITASLKGNLRVLTILDYLETIGQLANNDQRTQCLSEYIGELCLLQSDLGEYPQSQIAACCVLLSRLQEKKEYPWPRQLQEFTGFTLEGLSTCAVHVHLKCFSDSSMVDHREVVLQAVKTRYADEKYLSVSETVIMNQNELKSLLGVEDLIMTKPKPFVPISSNSCQAALIMSPSRGKSAKTVCFQNVLLEREQAGTPTLESSEPGFDRLNESALSGYDGDKEDEGDSFLDYDEDVLDAPLDLESLWCSDSIPHKSYHRANSQANDSSCSSNESTPQVSLSSLPSIRISIPSSQVHTSDSFTSATPRSSSHIQVIPGSSPVIISNSSLLCDQSQISRLVNIGESLSTPSQSRISALGGALNFSPNNVDSGIEMNKSDRSPSMSGTPLSSRQALQTLNGNTRVGSSNVSVKPLKRKSKTTSGNENKTFVMSL